MEIHKPNPFHGWREFLKEVGIIVLGVLIALGAEQAVEWLHGTSEVREARSAVRAEIRSNLSDMRYRLATQACVEKRLDEIGELLARTQEGALNPPPLWIGQPSIWFMASQRWQAATGSGRVSLFDTAEQGRYATIYVRTSEFAAEEEREQTAWAQLRGLEGWRGPLGPAGKVAFMQALQQARYTLWSTRITLMLALQAGREVGIAPSGPADLLHVPRSACLPMDTPRAKALTQLGDASFGQPR